MGREESKMGETGKDGLEFDSEYGSRVCQMVRGDGALDRVCVAKFGSQFGAICEAE